MTNRLGATYLIELGSNRHFSVAVPHRPFLSNYPKARLGQFDWLADVGSFLAGMFSTIFHALGTIVNIPLDLASKGLGYLFDGIAKVIGQIPIIGELLAGIVLVGKTIIQWVLKVPGMILNGIGNLFDEAKKAIDKFRTPAQAKKDESAAKSKLLDAAEKKGGELFKSAISKVLEGKKPDDVKGVPAGEPMPVPGAENIGVPESSDLTKALNIGAPIAGGALLLLLLTGR